MRILYYTKQLASVLSFITLASVSFAQDVTTGLIHHQAFDDVNEVNLTLKNGTALQPGVYGSALVANKVAAHSATIAKSDALKFGSAIDFSINVWVKMVSGQVPNQIILSDKNNKGKGWAITTDVSGAWEWSVKSKRRKISVVTAAGKISDGKWHMLTITADRDGNATLYQDGVLLTRKSITRISNITTTSSIKVGKDGNVGAFHAGIDDVKIYNRVLSIQDIVALKALSDQDGDGMPTWYEVQEGFNDSDPTDAQLDLDGDGVININEFKYNTNPSGIDTLGLGLGDKLAEGLVAYLPLDGSGFDKAGGIFSLEQTDRYGWPEYHAGVVGDSVNFNKWARPHQELSLPKREQLNFGRNKDFSVSVWVNSSITLATDSSIMSDKGEFGRGWEIGTAPNGGWRWGMASKASGILNSVSYKSPANQLNDGRWHLLTVTNDRDGDAVFYYDGVEVSRKAISHIGNITLDHSIVLGAGAIVKSNWFHGNVDEARIYDRVLTAEEVSQLANMDSNGDLITDGDAANVPANAYIQGELYSQVSVYSALSISEGWLMDSDGSIVSSTFRGKVNYKFNTDEDGVWIYDIAALVEGDANEQEFTPVEIFIDGISMGREMLLNSPTFPLHLKGLTPHLAAGKHEISIHFLNLENRLRMRIKGVEILSPTGDDLDANGRPDWLDTIFIEGNKITHCPPSSKVSPICIEGSSRVFSDAGLAQMTLDESGAVPQELILTRSINKGYFVNAELNSNGSASSFHFKFEKGNETIVKQVSWTPTNVLEGGTMVIRVGDSLRLAATTLGSQASDPVAISVNSLQLATTTSGSPIVHQFTEAGVYTVTANLGGGASANGTMIVEVLESNFGEAFTVFTNYSRVWCIPGLASEAKVEVDEALYFNELGSDLSGSRQFKVTPLHSGSSNVIARTKTNGPILAIGKVKAPLFANTGRIGAAQIIKTLEDGRRIIAANYVIEGPIPDDFKVKLTMSASYVVFLDGSRTKYLTASDFGANGIATVYYEKSGDATYNNAICHRFSIYGE